MLKKTITYTDYEGMKRTEDFYFNLSKTEITKMDMSEEGGLQKRLDRIVQTRDNKELISVFDGLIKSAYGEKSADGKQFIKKPELAEAFSYTEAYDILFMELVSDVDKAAAFIKGILPSDIQSALDQNTMDEIKAKANIDAL